MKKERNKDQTDLTQSIVAMVESSQLPTDVSRWLTGQAAYMAQLVKVFVDDPDTFQLHSDLRADPLLIVQTVLQSAEKLYEYQGAYDEALREIANSNGIAGDLALESVPQRLQEISVPRERDRIQGQYADGGVVAIGLMGTGASGKGTVGKKSGMDRVVNVTTRPKRPTEEHGKDYLYIREMYPRVSDTLDIDTGYNVLSVEGGTKTFELGDDGKPLNYFDNLGPYLTEVHRPGRARHGTPVSQFKDLYESGKKAIFFEHGPVQVAEAGEKLPDNISNAIVVPVCILPPDRGVIALAIRMAVRTYGDPEHQDEGVNNAYKIDDRYLESTIGLNQIAELKMTQHFLDGDKPLGIAYIVNDKLAEAVQTMKQLVE